MKLVFLLEEKSMKFFLDGILPRILPQGVEFLTIPHEGKSDLQKSVPKKLKGWNEPNVKFVIVQDQDSNDCRKLKNELVQLCKDTGREVLIRIACHELEAWYLGDLEALSKVYCKKLITKRNKSIYRIPDAVMNPKQELKKMLPEHQQILGAKKIAECINIENNSSESFGFFVRGVLDFCKCS